MSLIRLLFPLLALSLAACSGGLVYRLDIEQGNYLDEEMLAQLEVGMTREQVEYLLGTPMIRDPFHPERWDYPYYFDSRFEEQDRAHRVTVYFDGERVTRIEKTGFADNPPPEDPVVAAEPPPEAPLPAEREG